MFEKLQRAFWKALTPDLIAETEAAPGLLSADVLKALGECAAKHRKVVEAWPT